MMLHILDASMVYGSTTMVELRPHEQHRPIASAVLLRAGATPRFSFLLDGTLVAGWLLVGYMSDKLLACCGSQSDAELLCRIVNTTIHLDVDSDPIEDAALLQKISAGVT